MDIMYIGNAGVIVKMRGGKVIVDPTADYVPTKQILRESNGLKLIFVTHEHREHFDRELVRQLVDKYKVPVVAPANVLSEIHIINSLRSDVVYGDYFDLNGFNIRVLKASHPQSRYPVSYVVSDGMNSFYHIGDSYETQDMLKVYGDVCFMPVKGMETMGAIQASRIALKMNFKKVMPVYWSSIRDVDEFMSVVGNKGLYPEINRWVKL